MEWLSRMMQAVDRLEEMLEDRLDVEEVARTALCSPFHFQRMFSMLTGFTVAEYVRKRRLTLAAQELASGRPLVIDVALKYGYETPEAFAKAFRRIHGVSPSAAREPGTALKAFPRISFQLSLKGDVEMEYRLVEREAFTVMGKWLMVKQEEGNSTIIPKFWQDCNADGTSWGLIEAGAGNPLLGVCCEFCHVESRFKYWAAVESSEETAQRLGYETMTIPAALWAVFPAVGPMPDAIQKVWSRIYSEWFPSTGYEHAAGPELEVYLPGDPSSEDYRTEVWIPVRKKA